jgi:FAD/FMN-containing dehydrogenase
MKDLIIIQDLKKICKASSYKEDKELIKKHSADWRGRFSKNALGVVFPTSTKEVSKIIKYSNKRNIKVIPQGGNTGLVGGTSPTQNKKEIIINFEKMNKIIEIDKENRCIEAEAGTIIDNIISAIDKEDYLFPLKMSSTGSSQVGGAIATNAGGINVVKHGSIRQNILALEVVLANGESLKLGSKVIKDNTGYNLKDLFCGSEGTLGIVTKATFKIYPKPKDYVHCFISFKDLSDVLTVSNFLLNEFDEKIESLELIPDLSFELCIKHKLLKKSFFQNKSKYYLLLKLSLFEDKFIFMNNFEEIVSNLSDKFDEFLIAQNENQSNDFWKFRESLTEAQKLDGKLIGFDISIPISNMNLFFQESKKELKKILPNIKFHTFGHLGDSNIHFNLIEPDNFKKNFYSYEKAFKNAINKILIKVKGSVSAEHGIGLLKKDDLKETKSAPEIRIMKKIKKLLDPNNILNQKKIF